MNINPTFFIIMGELLAVESIILIVLTILYIRRKRQCRAVLQNIISATEASDAERQKVLENTLKDIYQESDEENASQVATKLVKAESQFHKKLLTTFISQDHDSLSGLYKWTDKLLSPYRAMISSSSTALESSEKQTKKKMDSLKHTVDALSKEKCELKEELDGTKKELDSIMSEYVSAFDKEKQEQEKAEQENQASQTNNIESPDAEDDAPADEGIMVESDDTPDTLSDTGDEISIEDNEAEDSEPEIVAEDENSETEEISIDDSDDEDEGMLKVEDLEGNASIPDKASEETQDSDAQESGAILDDVDIETPPASENNTEATEVTDGDMPPKAAAQ